MRYIIQTTSQNANRGDKKMNIGVMIKSYLEDRGISQAYVSRKTNINPVKLNLALNGNRTLSLEEYALICGALKVDTNKFLKPRIPEKTKEVPDALLSDT
jgi:transcriptional regulator with XRE-family HTH domain